MQNGGFRGRARGRELFNGHGKEQMHPSGESEQENITAGSQVNKAVRYGGCFHLLFTPAHDESHFSFVSSCSPLFRPIGKKLI